VSVYDCSQSLLQMSLESYRESSVRIHTTTREGILQGSGLAIASNQKMYFITNKHVIAGATELCVYNIACKVYYSLDNLNTAVISHPDTNYRGSVCK
jgi:hypothetical protein